MSGSTSTPAFVPGDLVISISGDGDGSGQYGDNQASPVVLEQINPLTGATVAITGVSNGTLVNGELVLPQTATTVNGVKESVFSGEYGSSSEGSLELSADGHSLVIGGYGVNAAAFNSAEATGGSNAYGNTALAQTTSVPGNQYTPVARVVADIGATGAVDTSTAVLNVFNTNNIRSVATVNGSSFFISGQGVKGDTTQGVFTVADGASSATAIDTSTDTRTVEISNGTLYVSRDSTQPKGSGTSNIASYRPLPTGATAPATLHGIAGTDTLTAAQENTVNGSAVGTSVHLSPENFFFANSTTLYVADSGNPKQGGVGDGGLQKWTLNTTTNTWGLDYTLSAGLNLVNNDGTAGTTGLIGLTGAVSGGTVDLYATNATIGDTDPTFLFGITDQLSATTAPTGESFTTLTTAASDTNIRGVAFAPTVEPACFLPGTPIRTPLGDRAIETLRAGDLVTLADGGSAPVRWVARQTIATRFCAADRACPVRVRAGAFAPHVPAADLLVSPDHAFALDGVLVHAGALVNGASIVRETGVPERFTYWNLELDHHALILAAGTVAETFVDNIDRGVFDNARERPDDLPAMAELAMPRAKSARQVPAAIRAQIETRMAAVAGPAVAAA